MRWFSPAHVVLLQKGWQAVSGFVTVLLVTRFLSPEQQGYYYAIGSLLSGYVLLDLGLSGLLVQISARMLPGLEMSARGALAPGGASRSAFLSMVSWSRRWYVRAGALALLLMPVGFLYFSYAKPGLTDVHWQWPWIVVVLAVAASLPAYPALSVIEGAGRIREVYSVRLGQYGLAALLAWSLLVAGAGLYAPAMAPLSVALVGHWWARWRYGDLFSANHRRESGFAWRESVWPLQRRVAVSWLASYLFLNSPTLIVFYFGDASSAGRLGLSITVANLVGSLCASWLIAKVPRITHLVAEDRGLASKVLFLSEFRKAFGLMFAAYASGVALTVAIGAIPLGERLLPPSELAPLFGTFVVFHSVGMLSVYFRALGREALAAPIMVATLISMLAASLVARVYGVGGVVGMFLFAYVVICIPWMVVAWRTAGND